MPIKSAIVYFENPGPENTQPCISVAKGRLDSGDIQAVVVATTSGMSALEVAKQMPNGISVYGMNHQPSDRVDAGIKSQAEKLGVAFLPDTPTVKYLRDIDGHIPDSFRRFGQGMKVAVEVAMQAVEAGFVDKGTKLVSLGGTSKGLDTAIIIQAVGPEDYSEIWVSEILAKPL